MARDVLSLLADIGGALGLAVLIFLIYCVALGAWRIERS